VVDKLKWVNVVDIEATCWPNEKASIPGIHDRHRQGTEPSEIIEIGICQLNPTSGVIRKKKGIIVKPEFSAISAFCTQLTSISPELIEAQGITYQESITRLLEQYNSKNQAWASWGDYDRHMFKAMARLHHTRYPWCRTHINVKTYFALHMGLSREVPMAKALDIINEPLEGTHHRGVDDAYNIAKILRYMINQEPPWC
jgi:inhibitor of KinA sporulation pathway (predicted exonuclease)